MLYPRSHPPKTNKQKHKKEEEEAGGKGRRKNTSHCALCVTVSQHRLGTMMLFRFSSVEFGS